LSTVFYSSRHYESLHAESGIVFAGRLKIGVHHVIVAGCGREMGQAERIQVDCRMGDLA
jgi:hypothetical protein